MRMEQVRRVMGSPRDEYSGADAEQFVSIAAQQHPETPGTQLVATVAGLVWQWDHRAVVVFDQDGRVLVKWWNSRFD
ncbi:MAG: hypothetical protein WCP21_04895 [Armatimonadota bacterium]